MRVKKSVSLFMVVVGVFLLFSGCSVKPKTENIPPCDIPMQTVTKTFLHRGNHPCRKAIFNRRDKMLIHRCPWCGERLRLLPQMKCPVCKNKITIYSKKDKSRKKNLDKKIGILFLLILCFTYFPFRFPFAVIDLPWWADLVRLLILDGLILWIISLPYERKYMGRDETYCIEKQKMSASIVWETKDREGLSCPKLLVKNGEIFPACFMNADGQPISTALCVVLENIHWESSHRCMCTIQIVLDDVSSKNLFQKGNTFNLYHNYRLIAKGILQ